MVNNIFIVLFSDLWHACSLSRRVYSTLNIWKIVVFTSHDLSIALRLHCNLFWNFSFLLIYTKYVDVINHCCKYVQALCYR